jgi:hypothetical protein
MYVMVVLAILSSGQSGWLINDTVQPYKDEVSCQAAISEQIENLNGVLKLQQIPVVIADAKCQKTEEE